MPFALREMTGTWDNPDFSSDAFRLSSREFLAGYSNMRKNQAHTEKVSNRPLAKLRDLLDE
jgi:hypothetical protein